MLKGWIFMIKILHSADWHLDSPIQGRSPEQTAVLKEALLALPGKIAALCKAESCDMMLLSGDIFDGQYTRDSYLAVKNALEEVAVPVFIAPGNHDFYAAGSPWTAEVWPENVYIFSQNHMAPMLLRAPSCAVCGAAFTSMDCDGLLEGFSCQDGNMPTIGILHGDPTQISSPYCPITSRQVEQSGLSYLALGHIHKQGAFTAGSTLCAWPGSPMGRGYDEQGEKGVLIVNVDVHSAEARFVPLDAPKFYDLETATDGNPAAALAAVLPAVANNDFYRVTFTGESQPLDLDGLKQLYAAFPNLELRDRTVPPVDIWGSAGDDTFEGMYFKLLKDALETADSSEKETILLAAEISRRLLDGQEVRLP